MWLHDSNTICLHYYFEFQKEFYPTTWSPTVLLHWRSGFEELIDLCWSRMDSSPICSSHSAHEVIQKIGELWRVRQRILNPPRMPQNGLANSTEAIQNSMQFISEYERSEYISTYTSVIRESRLLDILGEFGATDAEIRQQRVCYMCISSWTLKSPG